MFHLDFPPCLFDVSKFYTQIITHAVSNLNTKHILKCFSVVKLQRQLQGIVLWTRSHDVKITLIMLSGDRKITHHHLSCVINLDVSVQIFCRTQKKICHWSGVLVLAKFRFATLPWNIRIQALTNLRGNKAEYRGKISKVKARLQFH